MAPDSDRRFPSHVGIRGMELYIPKLYVEQSELEKYDGVGEGKYTRGLGQQQMSFCADHEDIVSICLTVVSRLLNNYEISADDVGFLCVGTETLIDKSKSVKTSLMRLFGENCDIEGIDAKNACYGGTQALFHAVDWIYANWEVNRAGAFAALVGPNALVYFEKGLRAIHAIDSWDFYKPNRPTVSEYPVVDGPVSLQSYFSCADHAYGLFCIKAQKLKYGDVDLSKFDALFFHCPFTRLVQKALGLLAFSDYKRGFVHHLHNIDKLEAADFPSSLPQEAKYLDRSFTQLTMSISEKLWKMKTEPFLLFSRRAGNMYTASLYSQLIAFFHNSSNMEALDGQRLLFFSYGSGAISAMFSARISLHENELKSDAVHQYRLMKKSSDKAAALLEQRLCIDPKRYNEIMVMREKLMKSPAPYKPEASRSDLKDEFSLFPETFYLDNIDDKYRRSYSHF